jgi:Domain of unknown function (DUF4365)
MENHPARPSSHVIGDVGETEVALVFKKWGWTADSIDSDYGEDLDCNIFTNQQRTAFHFRCQVKSSRRDSKYLRRLKNGYISVKISSSLARFWIISYYPVLLVIYVDDADETYWIDATHYLRENLNELAKKQIIIRVNTASQLSQNQSEVEKTVQNFYSQMLRFSSPSIKSYIIPVIMPDYKILEFKKCYNSLDSEWILSRLNLKVELCGILPEYLPAWITALRSINLHHFNCFKVTMIGTDIATFSDNIIQLIRHIDSNKKFKINDNQWLSFICEPYRIVDQKFNELSNSYFNQEVTDWWSYCCLNDVKSDYEYAFDLPKKYLIPNRYHGFSWDFNHLIIPDKDLGVKFFGRIPMTPALLADKKLLKDFVLSQFISWTCPVHQVNLLRSLLAHHELQFCEIPDFSSVDYTVGAICDHLFSPMSGMIPTPENWNDLEINSIITRLEEDSLIAELPGTQEGKEVEGFVLSFFKSSLHSSNYSWIEEKGFIPGLPIDHTAREISIQRYKVINYFNEEFITKNLMACKNHLKQNLDFPDEIEITPDVFEHTSGSMICVLSISWCPNLSESSLESVERFIDVVFQAFNQAIPEGDIDRNDCKNTREIVERYGCIMFEEFCAE